MNTDFEKQIENLPKKGNSIKDKLFNKDYFLRSTEFGVSTTEKEEIIFDTKKSNNGTLIIIGLAILFICFRFKDSDNFIPILIFSGIGMIANLVYLKFRKSKLIKINLLGFEIENIKFEWDARKATANEKKHGISFDEARTVFFDENAKLIDDPDHSNDEDRFVLLGLSSSLKVVLVCHCYREVGNVIRIISARKATKRESTFYGGETP